MSSLVAPLPVITRGVVSQHLRAFRAVYMSGQNYGETLSALRGVCTQDSAILFIQEGAVPDLIEIFTPTPAAKEANGEVLLQNKLLAASMLMTILHQSEFADTVVQAGILPICVAELQKPTSETTQQLKIVVMECIGRISYDAAHRDLVLAAGALPLLLSFITPTPGVALSLTLIYAAVLALFAILQERPHLENTELVKTCLRALAALLLHVDWHHRPAGLAADESLSIHLTHESISFHICRIFSHYHEEETSDCLVACGIIPKLMEIIETAEDTNLLSAAAFTCGNISCSSDAACTQALLDDDILRILPRGFQHEDGSVLEKSCYAAANILAGSHEQIQSAIDAQWIVILKEVFDDESKSEILPQELYWALSNLFVDGSNDHVRYGVDLGLIKSFCSHLGREESDKLRILNAFVRILEVDAEQDSVTRSYRQLIRDEGGIELIQDLADNSEDGETKDVAQSIMDSHFGAPEEA